MKIHYISTNFESVQPQLAEALISEGNIVNFFYYTVRKKKSFINGELLPNYVVNYNSPFISRGPLFFVERLFLISRICKKRLGTNADYYIANQLFTDGIVSLFLTHKEKNKIIVSIRNTDLRSQMYWRIPWIKYLGFFSLVKAHKIIFQNPSYMEEFKKKIPRCLEKNISDKMYVVKNGIDSFWLNNMGAPKSLELPSVNIISVGRIIPRKNQILVQDACKLLIKNGYEVTYTIIGKAEDISIANKLRLEPWTKVLPFMDKEHLIKEYAKSDIFVMPSKNETFGLVYAEAISQGLPVIYSQGEGFDAQFVEGFIGYHVNSNDSTDVFNKITKIINNYDEISKNCITVTDGFNWREISKKYLN